MTLEAGLFALVAGVYWAYFAIWGDDRFYYDSQGYWDHGKLFDQSGHFSLVSYDDPVRGYSLPLFNFVLQKIAAGVGAGSVTIVEISGGLLAAILGVVVLPRLARALFSGADVTWSRILALNGLLFFFWRGHFNYPLSDFPALVLAAIGMIAFLRGRTWGYLAAGVALGLAANVRTAYLPVLVLAILGAAFIPRRQAHWTRREFAVVFVVLGALVSSAPQMLINHHHRASWSPFVPGARQLSMDRFTAGLLVQRTETYVGPPSQYPVPLVYYLDPIGMHVRSEEGARASEIRSYGDYLGIVRRHPLDMLASYGLHTFNGLEIRYPTPYVPDLSTNIAVRSLLSYTLFFFALALVAVAAARRKLGVVQGFGIAMFLSPILTAISSALEPRYFLPAHALIYVLVCFSPAVGSATISLARRTRVGLLVAFACLLVVWVVLSASVSSQTEYDVRASASTGHVRAPAS